ncbi:MAG: peptidase M28, partial [Candidatus Omnitrophica bacterium]|nr:peptidase M28 [Candidatus Omnitrophota bacterium]
MWELIQANKRRSVFIFICMGACLIILGYFLGVALLGPSGGFLGLLIAFLIWFILSLISYFSGDSIILQVSRAKEVSHDVHPRLYNIVEEMKIAAN